MICECLKTITNDLLFGIEAYLSPEKKSPSTASHNVKEDQCSESEVARSSEGDESTFESAKSSTNSDESHVSVELQNLNWTKDVERVMRTDIINHQTDQIGEAFQPLRADTSQGRHSRYPSSLFTEDLTVGEFAGFIDNAREIRSTYLRVLFPAWNSKYK